MKACYSRDRLNDTSYNAMTMAIISLQAFAGMWINAFIASVLCIAWVKKKSFSSNEKILLFLGCCRFWYLCISWVYFLLSIYYPWHLFVYPLPQLFSAFNSSLSLSNLCVSACLCIFYCVKIANFRHTFFIYLKGKIDKTVPWLLLGSVLLSLVIGILAYDIVDAVSGNKCNSTAQGNVWKLDVRKDEHLIIVLFINGFVYATTFIAVISSALLLLFSLWRHKCKMQTDSKKNISTDAHVKAIKSILSFFVLYSINFTCLILMLIYATKSVKLVDTIIVLFQSVLPTFHSLVLIFSNPQLEKTLRRTLSCVKCKVCMSHAGMASGQTGPWLLLGSVLLSLVIGFLAYDIVDAVSGNKCNSTAQGNVWKLDVRKDEHLIIVIFINGFVCATTFIAVISSALLLLFSLWRHKCKMQTDSKKNISTDAHVKAIKSILSFFVLYSINFTCLILMLIYATKSVKLVDTIIVLFQSVLPTFHSLVLIFSNPQLEKTLRRTLSCVKCKVCMRQEME
ncbi:PREDICTED: taste receptor type 2 member 123-like [Calidris pugnax]|uniref:taste receptor type 2 member 123-like n=1 Tax=Calidris pugnax TaxID=198806 RepID=UPI00071C2A7B|nr:PREDICTED: taste receptor type 2 member 123-like [Calidris pugnax]